MGICIRRRDRKQEQKNRNVNYGETILHDDMTERQVDRLESIGENEQYVSCNERCQ